MQTVRQHYLFFSSMIGQSGRFRRSIVTKTVVLNRLREVCPSCFDVEVEKAGVCYPVRRTGWVR
jgi:hypothetical protein